MDNMDHLKSSINAVYTDAQLAEIKRLILNQNEQLERQNQQLAGLAKGFASIVQMLQKQGNPTKAIEECSQSIDNVASAVISLHSQLKQANFGQEFATLKDQQESLYNSIVNTQKDLKSQSNNLAKHLGWKRIAPIIVSTVFLSSLFSTAITMLAPVAINQITGKDQPEKTEKAQPVVKKSKKDHAK
jgi:ssDNA-specific exonuclease RecJ